MVHLWTPSRPVGTVNEYNLHGYVYDEHLALVAFSSRIRQVSVGGRMIDTDAGLVRLFGPLCRLPYETRCNIDVFNRVAGLCLVKFSYGFPKYWQERVTIIELVLAMDFLALDSP